MYKLSRFLWGSVWLYDEVRQRLDEGLSEEYVKSRGVLYGVRPVLIISNNTYNNHSPSVNCLKITANPDKRGIVHVKCMVETVSTILCEQVCTINKKYLKSFKGVLHESIMEEVIDKVAIQFNMDKPVNDERIALDKIKEVVDEYILQEVGKNYRDDRIAVAAILKEAGDMVSDLMGSSNKGGGERKEVEAVSSKTGKIRDVEKSVVEIGGAGNKGEEVKEKKKKRVYTEEEKKFTIENQKNPKAVAERLGVSVRYAYKLISNFKEQKGL